MRTKHEQKETTMNPENFDVLLATEINGEFEPFDLGGEHFAEMPENFDDLLDDVE